MPKTLPVLITFILITLLSLILLIGIYYYNWNDLLNKWLNLDINNNYEKFIQPVKQESKSVDLTSDLSDKTFDNNKIEKSQKISKFSKSINDLSSDKNTEKVYGKGSNIGEQSFHSLGEFVSEEEQKYRETLVKNLRIKTVIINSLTKGNGISQEYYKVVYQNKMIPAKILEQLVESKEFRNLIPIKYLTKDIEKSGLKNGDFVKFKNTDIIKLLKDWSLGRLTPVQKAWSVKAEK